jgi:hypothetical protein
MFISVYNSSTSIVPDIGVIAPPKPRIVPLA